jgi:hypothetical protein
MVVKKILKQLTQEKIKQEIKGVQEIRIPPGLKKWVKEYEKFGKRNEFTWKLFLKAEKEFDYLLIPKKYRNSLEKVYFLLAMFVILLDDVADKKQARKLLAELLRIISMGDCININKLNKKDREYLKFALKVWHRINCLIKKYPNYKKFEDLFQYDIKQIGNAMEYDHLVNSNHNLINQTEFWLYAPHTMQFIITSSIAFMCLPSLNKLNKNEFGLVREATWQALKMMRIGNWVSTWEREVGENDFSSGIFAYATGQKVITINELSSKNSSRIIKKIKKARIENKLLKEWESGYKNILAFHGKIKVINIKKFLNCLEKLLFFELISKKYK